LWFGKNTLQIEHVFLPKTNNLSYAKASANSQQPTANSQQPTANSQQPTAHPTLKLRPTKPKTVFIYS